MEFLRRILDLVAKAVGEKPNSDASDLKEFESQLFDFYKESYEAELDRRDKATARLTLNFAALTVLANITLAYLNRLPPFDIDAVSIWFFAALTMALICGVLAVYNYIFALVLGKYETWYIPWPEKIAKFIADAEIYNRSCKASERIDIETEFKCQLMRQYVEFATANGKSNARRSEFIYRTSLRSVLTLIFLLLCAPPFFVKLYSKSSPATEVRIVNPVEVHEQRSKPAVGRAGTSGMSAEPNGSK